MADITSQSSITEGSLTRPMLRLAWPIVVTELLQVAYNIADTIWLGRLSADALAAISLAFPLIFLLLSVGGGFTVAGSTLVAQYTGASSEGSAGKVAGQTLSFVTFLAVVLGIIGHFTTRPMLAVLPSQVDTAAQVIPLAADYMRVFFLGTPFLFGFFVFMALMRGYGNTKTPMRIMAISVALNVVLDPVLIFGWGPAPPLGVEGAAVATIFARAVATVMGLYVLLATSAGPTVELAHFLPDLSIIRDIVRVGTPAALEQSTAALALIFLTAMVVTFGPPVVAAYGLGARLVSLIFLPAMGLGRATNTMVGQNLGAGNPERAERAVWLAVKAGAGILFVIAILTALFPEPIIKIFVGTDTPKAAQTILYGTEYIRIRAIEFTFIGVLQVILGAYRGAGNTKTALGFSLLALWVGRVIPVYYFVFVQEMGPAGIWWGMALGNTIGSIAAVAWFTRGTWKRSVIDEGVGAGGPEPGAED